MGILYFLYQMCLAFTPFIEQVPLIGNIIRVMNFPNLLFIIEKMVCHLHSEHFETWVAYPQEAR